MVSPEFFAGLNSHLTREFKDVLAGQIYFSKLGTSEDQYKGLGDELKTALIPFRKSEYEAQEYLFARIPLRDPNVTFIDMIIPVLNVSGKSIQGIATFITFVPQPIPETFIERMTGYEYRLVPHSLAIERNEDPQQIIVSNMITSKAVNGMNFDKVFLKNLHGSTKCKLQEGFSSRSYTVQFNCEEYPPGMFTIVPFYGNSIMIAKDAGDWKAMVDSPWYGSNGRYLAFSTAAKYIAQNPEPGVQVGQFYIDGATRLGLLPTLDYLKRAAGGGARA